MSFREGDTLLSASVAKDEGYVFVVTEGGSRGDLTLSPGDTVEFCPDGCFVTLPNGDREALTGAETLEIVNGRAVYK